MIQSNGSKLIIQIFTLIASVYWITGCSFTAMVI